MPSRSLCRTVRRTRCPPRRFACASAIPSLTQEKSVLKVLMVKKLNFFKLHLLFRFSIFCISITANISFNSIRSKLHAVFLCFLLKSDYSGVSVVSLCSRIVGNSFVHQIASRQASMHQKTPFADQEGYYSSYSKKSAKLVRKSQGY